MTDIHGNRIWTISAIGYKHSCVNKINILVARRMGFSAYGDICLWKIVSTMEDGLFAPERWLCDDYGNTWACHFLELGWLSVALDREGRK